MFGLPRRLGELYKEDFQAVDIETISKPVTKWSVCAREPALVPMIFQQAFHGMRSGRPGPVLIDLPIDVQMAEIKFDDEFYAPLPVYKPAATRKQAAHAIHMLNAADRPLIVAGGGIINADACDLLVEFAELVNVPVIPNNQALTQRQADQEGATSRASGFRLQSLKHQCSAQILLLSKRTDLYRLRIDLRLSWGNGNGQAHPNRY